MQKKIRSVIRLVLLYAGLFILGTAGYIASFHTPLLAQVDVFFYRGLYLIALWGAGVSLLLLLLRGHLGAEVLKRDVLLFFLAFCCVNVVVFTHLPVTADRSITVFMLGYMSDHEEESFTEEDLKEIFEEIYVDRYGAFSKRLHEQEETGTILETEEGAYQISPAGQALMRIYEVTTRLYALDDRLVHPR